MPASTVVDFVSPYGVSAGNPSHCARKLSAFQSSITKQIALLFHVHSDQDVCTWHYIGLYIMIKDYNHFKAENKPSSGMSTSDCSTDAQLGHIRECDSMGELKYAFWL